LYDFSAQPGDSWIVPESYNIGFCDSVGVVNVVSVGDTIINSESLRYIVVEPEYQTHWVMFGKIIEKIGHYGICFLSRIVFLTSWREGR